MVWNLAVQAVYLEGAVFLLLNIVVLVITLRIVVLVARQSQLTVLNVNPVSIGLM